MTNKLLGAPEKRISIFLAVFLVVLAMIAPALGTSPIENGSPERQIVVFDKSINSQAQIDAIIGKFGLEKIKDLPLINGTVVYAGDNMVNMIANLPGVLRVEPDVQVHTLAAEQLPWGVQRINADDIWDRNHDLAVDAGSNAGNGVKVAIIDTGIDTLHPDLQDNIQGAYNAIYLPGIVVTDLNGHGSHVAGTIAAVDNAGGVIGVAPKVGLYPVKALNVFGQGNLSDVIDGIGWCVSNKMQVINLSLGLATDVQSLHDAITAAYNAGIVMVAAAGNSGPGDNTVEYPARYPEVLAVAATDRNNLATAFSSRGPEVGVAAPGESIYSTFMAGEYRALSGTSMACSHVSGLTALVIASGIGDSNGNGRINDEVYHRITSTADDLGVPGRDNQYGFGLVNASRALGF